MDSTSEVESISPPLHQPLQRFATFARVMPVPISLMPPAASPPQSAPAPVPDITALKKASHNFQIKAPLGSP